MHFSLPKICTSVSPLVNGAEFTLSFAKNVALFETPKQTIAFSGVTAYYRKRGSASYIVREVLSVRERERYREREREKDGSDVTIVALKLAMNTLSLAKNSHNWR